MARNAPWTKEQAREASLKAAEVKRLRRLQSPSVSPQSPQSNPNTFQSPSSGVPPSISPEDLSYVQKELAQVRVHIRSVAKILDRQAKAEESNPREIESLSRALKALRDQEQQLSGRPSPGAYRPEQPARRHSNLLLVPSGDLRALPRQRVSSVDASPSVPILAPQPQAESTDSTPSI